MNQVRWLAAALLLVTSLPSSYAGTVLRFHTSVGDFEVELYDTDKPITVQNFLTYVEGGYYNNMFMHRVVPNFVIQGGGYNVSTLGSPQPQVVPVTTLAPITNEFNVGPFYSNVYGTIAMAKTQDPNSATSEFFFNLADNSTSLDDPNNSGGFTVFGHVISGTNVLNNFLVGPANTVVKEVNLGGVFNELPVRYSADTNNVNFADLIYVDVGAPYTPIKATYAGLTTATPSNGVPAYITLATTAGSKLSGSLRLGTARYSFSGMLNSVGRTTVTAHSGKLPTLSLSLRTDLNLGSDEFIGTLNNGTNWVADVTAYRAASPASSYLGKYTMAVSNSQTAGEGVAAVSVNPAGKVSVKGTLPDGTAFTQSVPLAGNGTWPLYAALRPGGSISGWMHFTNSPGAELGGSGQWLRVTPAGVLTNDISLAGMLYNPTPPVLSLSAYQISFGALGDLEPFANDLKLVRTHFSNTSANKLTLSLSASTGLFSGTVRPPGSLVSIRFKGALFQTQDGGYGYFLQGGQSGSVWLHP